MVQVIATGFRPFVAMRARVTLMGIPVKVEAMTRRTPESCALVLCAGAAETISDESAVALSARVALVEMRGPRMPSATNELSVNDKRKIVMPVAASTVRRAAERRASSERAEGVGTVRARCIRSC